MDQGILGSPFSQVASYGNNTVMTYTLTNTTDGISSGSIYTFKYIAFNVKGFSAFSNEVRFAAA